MCDVITYLHDVFVTWYRRHVSVGMRGSRIFCQGGPDPTASKQSGQRCFLLVLNCRGGPIVSQRKLNMIQRGPVFSRGVQLFSRGGGGGGGGFKC